MAEDSIYNKYQEIIKKYHLWINKSVGYEGDDEDELLLKRIHWRMCVGAVSSLLPLIPISYILGIYYWTILASAYVVFNLINLIIFYLVRRGVERFALGTQLFHVLFSFTNVLLCGGILFSGGAVFIGIFGPFYALIFPNRKRAIAILIFYLVSIVVEALLQPYLVHYPPITPLLNIIFFVSQFSVVIIVFFFLLSYYSNQSIILKQAEVTHLRELDSVKANLYTNITHEFRTPLTLIIGLAEQLIHNPKIKLNEELQIIKRNGKNLLRLINQMLDLSKLEAKAMPVNLSQGDIIGYLKYVIESFESLAKSKKINLHILTEIDQLKMDFDAEKIMQIISNLLSNSIKFTPEEGDIYVAISKGISNSNNQLIVKVKDTGKGIPADKLPSIFNRFYKADNDSTMNAEGTGIGLALSKELVTLLKGNIYVESELSKGTEVTIILPITNKSGLKHNSDITRLVSEISSFIPDTIKGSFIEDKNIDTIKDLPILLLVEDNLDVIRYVKSLLIGNYNVYTALNGREGLNKALEVIPDIVISDVMMPEMDGLILCEKLKTNERTSHIPIILLTAKATVNDKLNGLEIGADDYIMKPFEPGELRARIKNLIEQRKRIHEYFKRKGIVELNQVKITSIDKKLLQKTFKIINDNISNPSFSVETLAENLTVSRYVLYKKIVSLTGESPVELIKRVRLLKAASLIENKFGNLSEIALEVGFNNPAYFSECFKKQFGVPPSQYLQKITIH
jgi:signal transduction histidine kinase/DNA-binding response OmpR family regulator